MIQKTNEQGDDKCCSQLIYISKMMKELKLS